MRCRRRRTLVATALLLVGTAREWNTIDHADPSVWIFVLGLAGYAIAILLLLRRMAPAGPPAVLPGG